MKGIAAVIVVIIAAAIMPSAVFAVADDAEPTVTFFAADNPEDTVVVPRAEFDGWFDVSLMRTYDPAHVSTVENQAIDLCPTPHPLCDALMSMRYRGHVRVTRHAAPRTADIERFAGRVADELAHDAVDARFRMEDGRVTVFTPNRAGIVVDAAATAQIIAGYADGVLHGTVPQTVKLPSRTTDPKITIDAINDLGITEIIGEGRSNFAGSPANRMHNIRTAAAKMEGVIIAPGEEFSFGTELGDVDGSTGYLQELVIRDHQTKPEYGGGICQVSSTLFRAAIYTGLAITQRRNHSYPVRYYQPIGFDATTYGTNPDLRFRNNTGRHILLHSFIEGTELVFQVYGTPDGRSVEMKGPFVTQKNPDGSMKTYFTQKVTARDGTVIIDDTFTSNYKSPALYPKPGDVVRQKLTSKPADWSKRQWEEYKRANGI